MNLIKVPFWIVTLPTPVSMLADICFKTDWECLQFQFLGGLRHDQIFGIFTDEAEALREAGRLLAERSN